MDTDATAPCAIPFSRNDANGVRYHYQHVCCDLRAGLGRLNNVYSLGYVVARCCRQCCLLPLATVPNVGILFPFFHNLGLTFVKDDKASEPA